MAVSSTPSTTLNEIEAYEWKRLIYMVGHIVYELNESGCLESEEKEHYKALEDTVHLVESEALRSGDPEKIKRAKHVIISVLEELVERLFGCT